MDLYISRKHEHMRRRVLVAVFLSILAIVSSCSDGSATPTEAAVSQAETYQIALVMKTLTNPFFIEMERGARQAEDELDIELIVRTAAQETSIEQQIAIVDELIRDQVDAIVIAPGDSLRLIPVLKQAQDAGIVIINIDNALDEDFSEEYGLVNVPFISVDNEQGAYLSASYMVDQLEKPAEVIILEGIADAKNAQDRKAGAMRAFAENDMITVIATDTANWKIDEGYRKTQALFETYPDVSGIFAANDMMALGAIQYLEEANRSDVLVAAYDALDEAIDAISDGKLIVTIDQQAALQGAIGVEYAVKALNGEELPEETLVDVLVVNAETLP